MKAYKMQQEKCSLSHTQATKLNIMSWEMYSD